MPRLLFGLVVFSTAALAPEMALACSCGAPDKSAASAVYFGRVRALEQPPLALKELLEDIFSSVGLEPPWPSPGVLPEPPLLPMPIYTLRPIRIARVQVFEVFKGPLSPGADLQLPAGAGDDCLIRFEKGQYYLFYADTPDGTAVSRCSGSREASRDDAEVRSLRATARGGR